ncbi:hypothetical protein [Prevotella sp. HCN-7019]|uniref:hypothetical protein n=1 Tax=Prevotella sp. HCN-7019 TaxID=3134668 RepID=UPI0030C2A216
MKSLIFFIPEFRSSTPLAEGIKDIANKYNLEFELVTIKKDVNPLQQQQFLYAVHVSDIVVVDCTIPSDFNDGGVYPALTAQVNILNHVIVVSENNLPLNITPLRGVFPQKDGERYTIEYILKKTSEQIEQSLKEDTYSRIPEEMINDFLKYQKEMEEMLGASLVIRRRKKYEKTSVMISYRNSHSEEVEKFKSIITGTDIQSKNERHRLGCDGDYELKVLPPASLCGADEAHTPMRRWMLVGLLEDHIREVDEVWVYESRNDNGEIDYTKSWWTIAEMIMVANINYDNIKKIRVKVYNPIKQQFYETTPQQYLVNVTEAQHKRLARYLSNTRPDTMGPECLAQVKQLKMIANLMRHSTEEMKQQMLENLRANFELSVPKTLEEDERKQMIDDMIKMYSDPDEIERYAKDDVFQEKFWNDISYQTAETTDCFTNNRIDVDKFMSTPMDEVTGHPLEDFVKASLENEGTINLGTSENPLKYKVSKANIDRYLWLATRMGRPTVKEGNAPGLERIPIYNITRL